MSQIRNRRRKKKEKGRYLQITPDAPLVRLRKIFSRSIYASAIRTYVVYDPYTTADIRRKKFCGYESCVVYESKNLIDESGLEMAKRPVSVRVEEHVLDELDARAKSLGKKDRSAHLRDLIIDDLTTADEAQSASPEIIEVRREIRVLRASFQNGIMGLMLMLDRTMTPEQAEKWVEENL